MLIKLSRLLEFVNTVTLPHPEDAVLLHTPPTPLPSLTFSMLSSALVAIRSVSLLESPCLNQWPSHPKVALFPKWKPRFGVGGCVLTSNPRL